MILLLFHSLEYYLQKGLKYVCTDREAEKKNKSRSTANTITQKKSNLMQRFGFVDNRSETIAQRKLPDMVNSSPQIDQLKAFQKIDNTSPQAKHAFQFQAMEDDYSAGLNNPHNEVVQRQISSMVAKDHGGLFHNLSPSSELEQINDRLRIQKNIEVEWRNLVISAITGMPNLPGLDELLQALNGNQLNVNVVLVDKPGPGFTAAGQTINHELRIRDFQSDPIISQDRELTGFNVSAVTAEPLNTIIIRVYKQQYNPAGETINARYGLTDSHSIQVIIHELVMHTLPHWNLIKARASLTSRPDTIAPTIEALKANNIPGLLNLRNEISHASRHYNAELWSLSGRAIFSHHFADKVGLIRSYVRDLFEHIGKDGFDEGVRSHLINEVKTVVNRTIEFDTINSQQKLMIIQTILENLLFHFEDTLNSLNYGFEKDLRIVEQIIDSNLVNFMSQKINELVLLLQQQQAV